MLLGRVIEHLKAQNWFAVALDFVIVVTGVFIGIQVSNWNEARTESHREMRYLAALHEDFGAIIGELEHDIARFEGIAGAMKLLLDQSALPSPDLSLHALNEAAAQLITMEGTPLTSGTYTNLTGSGDLAIIESQALKNALTSFFNKTEIVELVLNTHEMQLVGVFQPYIISNLDYTSMLPDRGLPPPASLDPERILVVLPTPEFRNVVATKWDIATDLRNLLRQTLSEARAVETLLTDELDAHP